MISIRKLEKIFDSSRGPVRAVAGIDLEVAQGEFMVLLGPSGCGKTTTLRCVAGLERPGRRLHRDRRRAGGQRRGRDLRAAGAARHRHGVPELRGLAPSERVPECRSAAHRGAAADSAIGGAGARDGRATAGAPGRPQGTPGHGPERRTATARSPGPGCGDPAQGTAHGRAPEQPRRAPAGPDARRAAPHRRIRQRHLPVRDPRPGRGPEPGRPCVRDGRGRDPATGHAEAGLLRAPQPLCRPLCRRDELHPGKGGGHRPRGVGSGNHRVHRAAGLRPRCGGSAGNPPRAHQHRTGRAGDRHARTGGKPTWGTRCTARSRWARWS